jgi:hypothetical protein
MRKRKVIVFAACLLVAAFMSTAAFAATVTISGEQTRGTGPLRNAQLKSTPVTLPSDGVIIAASTSGASLWINDGYGNWVVSFYNLADAKGYRLPAGTYTVFPNLNHAQYSAIASITVEY